MVVGGVQTRGARMRKAATAHQVDVDGESLLFGIEIDALDVPRVDNTGSASKT